MTKHWVYLDRIVDLNAFFDCDSILPDRSGFVQAKGGNYTLPSGHYSGQIDTGGSNSRVRVPIGLCCYRD